MPIEVLQWLHLQIEPNLANVNSVGCKFLVGERSNSAKSSPATEKRCPKCLNGLLRPTDDGFECWNCSYVKYTNSAGPIEEDQKTKLSDREKHQIVDALQEQYMRAKGNARRSKLESSKIMNLEHAGFISDLMDKIKDM